MDENHCLSRSRHCSICGYIPRFPNASVDSSIDIGGGRSPSPLFGGVENFWEPGDILTGLRGVLLGVPEVLVELGRLLGLTTPNPLMVGGGVANLLADSVILSSTSARNLSSCSSVAISFWKVALLFDQGVATNSPPGEDWIEGD